MYLDPKARPWYAKHGIPLRRGYLFHGPPGTGKTSFSLALAGIFGIDIYVISLQDATEEELAARLTQLPRRCIVLVEDIDTAGLRRDDEPEGNAKEDKGRAMATSSSQNASNSQGATQQPISLSGLLNTIDGVASPEGHVLIMTTNKPESLDEALIRPDAEAKGGEL